MKERLHVFQDVWATPNARLLLIAEGTSTFGDWFYTVAINSLLFLSGGVLDLILFNVLRLTIPLLLMPWAGICADKFSRKTIMALADGGRLVLCLLLMVARSNVVWLLSLVLLATVLGTFFRPARLKLLPQTVAEGQRMALNAANGTMGVLSVALAPALAGTFLLSNNFALLFLLDSLTFLISLICTLRLHLSSTASGEPGAAVPGTRASWFTALKFSFSDRILGPGFLLHILGHILVGASLLAVTLIADQQFTNTSAGIGYLTSSIGVGSLFGMLLGSQLPKQKSLLLIGLCEVAFGCAFISFGFAPNGILALCAGILMGFFANIPEPAIWTLYQERTPEAIQGSVFGIIDTVTTVSLVVGSSVCGLLIARWGSVAAIAMLGGCIALVATGTLYRLTRTLQSQKGFLL